MIKRTAPWFFSIILIFVLSACESRGWKNPMDPNISPADWAPDNLTFQMISSSQIELQWRQNASVINGFIIERAEDDGNFSDYGLTSETQFRDTDISTEFCYNYRVRGFMGNRESESSTEIRIEYVHAGEQIWAGAQNGYIFALDITPDSKTAITANYENLIVAWDLITGEKLWESSHDANIWSLDINSKGDYLCTASWDGTVRVWSASTGTQKWSASGTSTMWSAKYSPGGDVVACGGSNELFLCDASSGKKKWAQNQLGYISAVDVSSDYVVSGGSSGIQAYSTANGNLMWVGNHDADVNAVSFSENGEKVVSGGDDSQVKMWAAGSGELLWQGSVAGEVTSLVFSPDDETVYSGSTDGRVIAWNVTSGISDWTVNLSGDVYEIDCSSDSSLVVAACGDKKVTGIDADDGEILWTSGEHPDEVRSVRIAPDNLKIIAGGGLNASDFPVRAWWAKNHWRE